jgi:hypothetical protein
MDRAQILVAHACVRSPRHDRLANHAADAKNRVQLTTDGFKVYLETVESAFNEEIDSAMLQKIYGADPDAERRYRPAKLHRTSRVSPAMAAGVTTRLFEVSDLVALLADSESKKAA